MLPSKERTFVALARLRAGVGGNAAGSRYLSNFSLSGITLEWRRFHLSLSGHARNRENRS